jgi:4'-phosphopantetheinyl transferase
MAVLHLAAMHLQGQRRFVLLMQPLSPRQLFDYTEGPRRLQSGYCDVWLLSARVDTRETEILEALLSTEERARADSFRFAADRVRSIVARGGLRRILSCYCDASANHIAFLDGSHGKPALLQPSSALEFNASHSGDCVLIGVTSGAPCGVDMERRRANAAELAIAEKFFCKREVEWLARSENCFLRLWVAKEAIIKAVGHGLSIALREVDVLDVVEGRASSITLRTAGTEPQTLWLNELALLPDYAAAVATVGEKRVIRLMPEQAGTIGCETSD